MLYLNTEESSASRRKGNLGLFLSCDSHLYGNAHPSITVTGRVTHRGFWDTFYAKLQTSQTAISFLSFFFFCDQSPRGKKRLVKGGDCKI